MTEYVRIAVEDIIIKKDDWEQYCKDSCELIKVEDLRFYEIEDCNENGDWKMSSWIIHIPIGAMIGIMFSVAYPEMAQNINDSIYPTISYVVETLKNMSVEFLRDELLRW